MGEAIRKIKVSKKKKKHVMKIKRRKDITHKIKIYCAKKFYEKYLEEHEKPIDLISKIKFDVCQVEHLFKFNPDCLDGNTLAKILDTSIDLNMILGIIFEHGQGKLKSLGVYESCIIILEKLYYMLNKVVKEFGIDLKLDYTPDDMRFKLQVMKISGGNSRLHLDRMIAMRDGVVIETGTDIEPSDILKGTNIMVEFLPNRFVNVPYIFYKKLHKIDHMSIHVQVAEYQELHEGVNTDYDEYDNSQVDDDVFLYLNRKLESTNIVGHITNIVRYIGLWDTFDQMSLEQGSPYIPYREVVDIKTKGKSIKYDIPTFITEYFDFL